MIIGTGIDLIEVERIAEKIAKENGFQELVFTPDEIKYCESKANKHEHYAARFAAKEAFLKALGSGWAKGISFHEIEIRNDEAGKPVIFLLGNTAKEVAIKMTGKISLSISHLKSIAAAMVIIEQ